MVKTMEERTNKREQERTRENKRQHRRRRYSGELRRTQKKKKKKKKKKDEPAKCESDPMAPRGNLFASTLVARPDLAHHTHNRESRANVEGIPMQWRGGGGGSIQ